MLRFSSYKLQLQYLVLFHFDSIEQYIEISDELQPR